MFGKDLESKVVGLNDVEVGEDLSQKLTAEHRSLQRFNQSINQSIISVRGKTQYYAGWGFKTGEWRNHAKEMMRREESQLQLGSI